MKSVTLWLGILGFLTYINASDLTPDEINEQMIHADDPTANIGFKVGTLGAGIDIASTYNDWISLRLNANGFNYSTTDASDYNRFLQADKEYALQTIGFLADFHLSQLRVTAGVYLNNNEITDVTRPKGNSVVYLNGFSYDMQSISEIQSTVTFNKIAPYVGIGWGNNATQKGWSVTLDIGLMYQGDPQLDLKVVTHPGIPTLLSDQIDQAAEAEAKKQLEDLSDFPFYPVVMVGFNYSF